MQRLRREDSKLRHRPVLLTFVAADHTLGAEFINLAFSANHIGSNTMKKFATHLGLIFGRSFFPFLTVLIILGTMWWGPWVTLILAAVIWYGVGHTV